VASFTPSSNLLVNTTYTGVLTTGIQDLSENGSTTETRWTFTTGSSPDTTGPTLLAFSPPASSTEIPTNKKLTFTFNEGLDYTTITTETVMLLTPNGSTVRADRTYDSGFLVLSPRDVLQGKTTYTVVLTTGLKDLSGNPLASEKRWSFITAESSDTIAPTIVLIQPKNLSVDVPLNASLTATFSRPMLRNTINATSFSIDGVSGAVTFDDSTSIATFTPNSPFAPNTTYTARVQTTVQDTYGNHLQEARVWTFLTGS
jgi:hypothetical protein